MNLENSQQIEKKELVEIDLDTFDNNESLSKDEKNSVEPADASNNGATNSSESLAAEPATAAEAAPPEAKKASAFPLARVLTASAFIFCDGFNSTSIFPYVGFMVEDFLMLDDNSKIG